MNLALVEHREDFKWLYNRLGDYRSKRILLNVLSYWMTNDDSKISELSDKYFLQYFDLDLIKIDKDEVFVDVGAYIGDTLIEYVKAFGADCYKKFYCYEIVPKNIDLIRKNIELFNLKNVIIRDKGVSNKNGFMYITQNEVSSIITLAEAGKLKVETVKLDDDI
ncbi:MAG: FkbM family methyltransferase, partial [Clostridia bacterium]|nr:FkbM family methyltransferase [Clostridia bacterium]